MRNFKSYNLITNFKKAGFFVFLLFLVLIISGCSIGETLKNIDQKIGETFNDFQKNEKNSIIDLMEEKKEGEEKEEEKVENKITREQKEKIDKWLEGRGLNRYGDDKSAMYPGGTPLFDEKTEKAIDRFDYLLNKFPKLLEIIEEDN